MGHLMQMFATKLKETSSSIKIFCNKNRPFIWLFISHPLPLLASWARMTCITKLSGLDLYTEDVQGKENELHQISIKVKIVGDILYIYNSVYVASGIHKVQ